MTTVIHIVHSTSKVHGGLGKAVSDYSNALSNSGVASKVFTMKDYGENFPTVNLNTNERVQRSLLGLLLEVFRHKSAAVHIHGAWRPKLFLVWAFSFLCGRNLYFSPHGSFEPWCLQKNYAIKTLALQTYQKWMVKHSKAIVVTTTEEQRTVSSLFSVNKCDVIPPPVDLVDIKREPEKLLLFISRIHEKKGLDMLVNAISKVDLGDWRLIIAGPDDGYLGELRDSIDSNKLRDKVEIFDFVDVREKHSLFQRAGIFILPTYSENFGIVIAEALGAGVPVITTKAAPWEIIEQEKAGWWVDVSEDELRKAIQEAMLLSASQLAQMGTAGRELVQKYYSGTVISKKLIRVYSNPT